MACSRLSWWRQEDQKVKVNFDHTVSLKPNWDGGSEKQANHSEDLEQTCKKVPKRHGGVGGSYSIINAKVYG